MDLPQKELDEEEEVSEPEDGEVESGNAGEANSENIAELAEEEITDIGNEKEEPITKEALDAPLPEDRDEARASKYVLYAQTYFFEKKYARALEEIKRALEYSPNSGVAHSLKGSINYKIGDIDKARSSWEEALRLDASLDNVEKMLKQLDKMEKKEPEPQETN